MVTRAAAAVLAPAQNNIFGHYGNPSLADFTCDVQNTTAWVPNDDPDKSAKSKATCAIKDVVKADVREYDYCSRRGTCDFSTGLCSCYTEYVRY